MSPLQHQGLSLCCGGEHLEREEEGYQREHNHPVEEPEKKGPETGVPQPGPDDVPGEHHEAHHGEDDDDQGVEEATHEVAVEPLLSVDEDKNAADNDAVTNREGCCGDHQLLLIHTWHCIFKTQLLVESLACVILQLCHI